MDQSSVPPRALTKPGKDVASGIFRRQAPLHERRYSIGNIIADNLLSQVRLGKDVSSGTYVALKMPKNEFLFDARVALYFTNEIQALLHLRNCSGAVPLVGYGTFRGALFIATEFLGERPLWPRDFASPAASRDSLSALCRALHEIHERGVVHRDVKPSNVFLVNGAARFIDFAIAQLPGIEYHLPHKRLATSKFMAPEQADPESTVDRRADIYSLGVTIYYLLSGGRYPFLSDPANSNSCSDPVPLHEQASGIPPKFSAVISKALERNPSHRPQTALELEAALYDCLP